MSTISVTEAEEVIREALKSDPDYLYRWRCKLAMHFYEALRAGRPGFDGSEPRICDDGAVRFLNTVFDAGAEDHPALRRHRVDLRAAAAYPEHVVPAMLDLRKNDGKVQDT